MSVAKIEYHAPGGWLDISDDVQFRTATFESQLAAIPGMFELTVNDITQIYSFDTGRELRMSLWTGASWDLYWGGFLTQYEMTFATIVDTRVPADVKVRIWRLRGVDYNILFDKRVIANYPEPTRELPHFPVGTMDGDAIKTLMSTYLDLSGDGLSNAGVENVASLTPDGVEGAYGAPGQKWRETMQLFANSTGAVWYIKPDKTVVNKARESEAVTWRFSDKPDRATSFGMREVTYTRDGTSVVNDAQLWGGSGYDAGVVRYGRVKNQDSIDAGLKMQYGATHFNQAGYFTTESLVMHASVIVTGEPGTVVDPTNGPDSDRGLQNPQKQLSLAWFHGMTPTAIHPGQVVTTDLWVMGDGLTPLEVTLPLRSLRITFPSPEIARFDGMFGIQLTDPYSLWAYMKRAAQDALQVTSGQVPSLSDSATEPVSGAWFASVPTPAPDGSTTVFTIRFPYLTGSTRVYKNGLIQVRGTAYTESDPGSAQITLTAAPGPGDQLYVLAQCA